MNRSCRGDSPVLVKLVVGAVRFDLAIGKIKRVYHLSLAPEGAG